MIQLRHDPQLRHPNTFRVADVLRDGAYHIEAILKLGSASTRWVTFTACPYGREVPELHEHAALTRTTEDAWQVEPRAWDEFVPKQPLLLTNVPTGTFDGR